MQAKWVLLPRKPVRAYFIFHPLMVVSLGKNYPVPRFCSFNVIIHSISCGDEHSAFIASNGYIYTMGSNIDGRLGISSRSLKNSPSPCLVEFLARTQAIKVSCGGAHTAALMGIRYCNTK